MSDHSILRISGLILLALPVFVLSACTGHDMEYWGGKVATHSYTYADFKRDWGWDDVVTTPTPDGGKVFKACSLPVTMTGYGSGQVIRIVRRDCALYHFDSQGVLDKVEEVTEPVPTK